eukprot:scaffold91071_cov33-Tisochrysis_lutea.AAC.2
MGKVTGRRRTMRVMTRKRDAAPMRRPCLWQTDCGTISPKMTMSMVATMAPTSALRNEAEMMEMSTFVRVLPSSSVHRSRLPCLRIG